MAIGQTQWVNNLLRKARRNPAPPGPAAPLQRSGVADWLQEMLQPGDLLLSGNRDSVSRLIQWGTMSSFSHASIALSNEQLIESYDWAGTPCDSDGGVGRLSVQRYATRSPLLDLAILRPKAIERDRFDEVTKHATHHSPPFPSTTGVLLAFAGLGDHPRLTIPGARSYAEKRLHLLGDGAARVTCAEFAARVYLESGLTLRFQTLRLLYYIELLRTGEPARLKAHTTPRIIDVSQDAALETTTLYEFVAGMPRALSTGLATQVKPDWVDLLMPGDFVQSSSFDLIAARSVEK